MARDDWRKLGGRVEKRLVRTLDVASILLLDAAVLALLYGVIWAVDQVTGSENKTFAYAKSVSHAIILVLYIVWAIWDVVELVRDTSRDERL